MTTTLTLTYSADFTRAEYHDGSLVWSPVHPLPPAHPDTPKEQLPSPPHDLHVLRGTRYRAPSRLLSHIPPFTTTLHRTAPAPIALELGLTGIDYADDGFIYLSAASHSIYLRKDTTLLIAHHTISDEAAVEGACAALRRAGLAPQAETLHLAAEHSRARALSVINYTIDRATTTPQPPPEVAEARCLIETLETARKIMMGEGI